MGDQARLSKARYLNSLIALLDVNREAVATFSPTLPQATLGFLLPQPLGLTR